MPTADCQCNLCEVSIAKDGGRMRCASVSCDDVHVCLACSGRDTVQLQCPVCCAPHQLYHDDASPHALRERVFREAFHESTADAAALIHPRVMIERAFKVYGERPLLGLPLGGEGAVRWWSYGACCTAVQSFATQLRHSCSSDPACFGGTPPAVVICAANSPGWLVADWACVVAALPSIVIDASTPVATALAMARDAARGARCAVRAVCVDAERESEWRAALQACADIGVAAGAGDGECRGGEISHGMGVTVTTTRAASAHLPSDFGPSHHCRGVVVGAMTAAARAAVVSVGAGTPTQDDAVCVDDEVDAALARGEDSAPVTCIFSFGSTGLPKPLWYDGHRWAEWTERNPPRTRRARTALERRSVRVSCAALFAPLAHGLARRTAWGELLHGGRLGMCVTRADGVGGGCSADSGGTERVCNLVHQICAIAPTSLSAAPRFYAMYERRFAAELARAHRAADEAAADAAAQAAQRAAADAATVTSAEAPAAETALDASEVAASAHATALCAVCRLGGPRLRLVAVGGAVVPPALMSFLQACFGVGGAGGGYATVSNGYGMSEVPGGIARDGVPLPGVEVRLRPIGRADDDDAGRSRRDERDGGDGRNVRDGLGGPCTTSLRTSGLGEILVKTSRGAITGSGGAAVLDGEGWYHTGDLGRWVMAADGHRRLLEVVERLSFTVKLTNGEFLAPQRVERAYEEHCPSVSACMLYARSGDLTATAVVVPCDGECGEGAAGAMLERMRCAAAVAQLRPWEVPGRVLLDAGPWDESNGCCSAHGKLRRSAIVRRHWAALVGGPEPARTPPCEVAAEAPEAALHTHSSSATDHLRIVSRAPLAGCYGSEATLLAALLAFLSEGSNAHAVAAFPAAARALHPTSAHSDWWGSFGGDSVAAVELIAQWEALEQRETRGEDSTTRDANGPSRLRVQDLYTLSPWELRRKAQLRLGRTDAAVQPSHGDAANAANAASNELEAGRQLGGSTMDASWWEDEASERSAQLARDAAAAAATALTAGAPCTGEAGGGGEGLGEPCVLLTGASGFLGPHLLAALLEAAECAGWATIAVLARGATDRVLAHPIVASAAAAARGEHAEHAGAGVGANATGETGPCSSQDDRGCQVRVFRADMAETGLGLAPADRACLQRMQIRAVIHSAAAVDHARPYGALRAMNVAAADALVALLTPRGVDGREAECSSTQASPQRPPPLFVLVSTMSVVPTATSALDAGWTGAAESLVPPACAVALESGYAQSKLVAEHHLAAAAAAGYIRLTIARLGLLGVAVSENDTVGDAADRRDWLSLLLYAVEETGASPAGLCAGERKVAVLPADMAAAALAAEATQRTPEATASLRVVNLDATAFGLPARPLAALLGDVDAARAARGVAPLRRELPYPAWRRLVAAAGPPATLALAMLPPEGRGGALRLPSGARRRLRDARAAHAAVGGTDAHSAASGPGGVTAGAVATVDTQLQQPERRFGVGQSTVEPLAGAG